MVKQSLYRLNLHNLECLMFHREGHLELLDIPDFLAAFVALKETKLVKGLGCSVYTPEAALKALNHEYIDAVQIPASLFDRRFEAAGVFTVAAEKNKVLYLRSGLLQGVLCMQADSLPPYLQPLTSYVRRFHATCEQFSIAPAQLALAWLLDRYPREFVLFGAELPEQVMSNVGGLTTIDFNSKLRNTLEQICPPQTTELLNPSYWRV